MQSHCTSAATAPTRCAAIDVGLLIAGDQHARAEQLLDRFVKMCLARWCFRKLTKLAPRRHLARHAVDDFKRLMIGRAVVFVGWHGGIVIRFHQSADKARSTPPSCSRLFVDAGIYKPS